MCLLKCFSEKLLAWNRDTFGNIFRRKKRVQRHLKGVMRALDARTTVGLLRLKSMLKKEWTNVLLQEELLWMQKSREHWLGFGEKNTKFFHTLTLVRRRRNKIEMLKDEDRS